MAPADIIGRLKQYYRGEKDQDLPAISSHNAVFLSVIFTLLYVLPFYLSKSTRPSPALNRDAPSVVRARIQTVTLACIVASASTLYLIVAIAKLDLGKGLHLLGWWPIDVSATLRSTFLVLILYTGPLFEEFVIEQNFRNYRRGGRLFESLSSWIGYRNYIAGPITEEVIFRSVIVPLHLLAKLSPKQTVLYTPMYFAIAHVHHFYEFMLTHPHTPRSAALGRTAFQFGFTTIFGWLAAFTYVRTGSIYVCILVHQFCNWYGVPRFWGRVRRRQLPNLAPVLLRGKDDTDRNVPGGSESELWLGWTVLYYILLVSGAVGFKMALFPLTQSSNALATFM